MKTIGIQSLGCRLNQYEADGIIQTFVKSNHFTAIPLEEGPDIAIINTCTVTEQADTRNQQLVKRILKKNPNSEIIMTGCYAQTDPEKNKFEGVKLVIGNEHKSKLFQIVDEYLKKKEIFPLSHSIRPRLHSPFSYGYVMPLKRTRAYLKIQDGCDKKCTYCKIPLARGPGVSRPASEVLEHAKYLEDHGIPEIILTGVNLGWYRDRKEEIRFVKLLEKLLNSLTTSRLRLSSIEPCDVNRPLAELSLHPKFCNFLHVPLQSGSAKILRAMKRSYTDISFYKRIEVVKEYNPNIFLGTDIMLGFPNENEEDFFQTIKLCKALNFAGIHAFRFSERMGTPAKNFAKKVPLEIIRKRMNEIQKVRLSLWKEYAQKQINKEEEVILEKIDSTLNEGLTSNYLRTQIKNNNHKKGQRLKIQFTQLHPKKDYTLLAKFV